MLNKVPEVTLYFWIIKILCTTVGETAADYLNDEPRPRPDEHDVPDGRAPDRRARRSSSASRRYVPAIYWLAVVLISVVGTLITDNLVDNHGVVARQTTTIVFSIALAATFAVWYASERTLSIHTIVTTRREAFYWLAVLFTFALGTAAGDLIAERLGLGYSLSALLFAGLIALVTSPTTGFNLDAVTRVLARLHPHPAARRLTSVTSCRSRGPTAVSVWGRRSRASSSSARSSVWSSFSRSRRRTGSRTESRSQHWCSPEAETAPEAARVLVVANKTSATPALVNAVRERAAAGPAEFVMLVPNPAHLAFDRTSPDLRVGDVVLEHALPLLEEAAGAEIEGRVATSPNAYDDIVQELDSGGYDDIILETRPAMSSTPAARRPPRANRTSRLPADDRHGNALGTTSETRTRHNRLQWSASTSGADLE